LSGTGSILDGRFLAEKGQLRRLAGGTDGKEYGKGAGDHGHPMTHDTN
jgi:hypothetical protein